MRAGRFQLIGLGLVGYFLLAIGGYLAFFVWTAGLLVMSRFAQHDSLRFMMKGGVALNLIVGAIVTFGFGRWNEDETIWEALQHGVAEHLVLAGMVAVILVVVFGVADGRIGSGSE